MNILIIYEINLLILTSAVLGFLCALLSYFLDYCFWPGSIFKFYLPWLASVNLRSRDPEKWEQIKSMDKDYWTREAEGFFWYKVLGGCCVCFNIWLALISWSLILLSTDLFAWYYGFSYVLSSSWLIRKLVGATY